MARLFNGDDGGSDGVKPSLPPITINPAQYSAYRFSTRRCGLIYNPADVTGSRCLCAARKPNKDGEEGKRRRAEAGWVRACVRGVHADTADHFPRLHFHD